MASVQAMLYRRPALRLTGLLTPALGAREPIQERSRVGHALDRGIIVS